MPDIPHRQTQIVYGSSGTQYELRNVGGAYSCSCPAWRNQSRHPDYRTCGHLLDFRGVAVEAARILPGGRDNIPATVLRRVARFWPASDGPMPVPDAVLATSFGPEPPLATTYTRRVKTDAVTPPVATAAPTNAWTKLAAFDEVFDEPVVIPEPTVVQPSGRLEPADSLIVTPEQAAKESFAVLLAETWDESITPRGYYMSEKLDGVRAYWTGKEFKSRLGNTFKVPAWFSANFPKVHLDGEFWMERGKFQETVAIVRRQDEPNDWMNLRFHVFDAPEMAGPFRERYYRLIDLVTRVGSTYLDVVAHELCESREHLRLKLENIEARGGEGVMLRDPESPYIRGRSSTLLKVKSFFDAEATIVGHTAGKGRHRGRLGAYECETLPATLRQGSRSTVVMPRGVRFSVGTGLSDLDRSLPLPIGTVITYRFQELTRDGIPRFPSFVGVRGDV